MRLMLYKGIEQTLSSIESLLHPTQESKANVSDWLNSRIDMNLYLTITQHVESLKRMDSSEQTHLFERKGKALELRCFNFQKQKMQKLNNKKKKNYWSTAIKEWQVELEKYKKWEKKENKKTPQPPKTKLIQFHPSDLNFEKDNN